MPDRLTLISSPSEDGADGAVLALLVLRIGRQWFGGVVHCARLFDTGSHHGAGVPHGWCGWLVLHFSVIGHHVVQGQLVLKDKEMCHGYCPRVTVKALKWRNYVVTVDQKKNKVEAKRVREFNIIKERKIEDG